MKSFVLASVIGLAVAVLIGCYSADGPTHRSSITATVNDTAWTASTIVYLNISKVSSTLGHFQFKAIGGTDTIELAGMCEQGSKFPLRTSYDYVRIRRQWGVYQDSGTTRLLADTIVCTQYGSTILKGTFATSVGVPRIDNLGDLVRLTVAFDVTYF